MQIFVEAIIVGIMTVIVGSLVGFILSKIVSSDLPTACKKWNKFHIMEISLFLTGVIIHLVCEFGGLNKWYCSNGNACK
tara:strand:- start:192 stop:428 length:237 start_codon:yes stop_codon:yes gene_type:complete